MTITKSTRSDDTLPVEQINERLYFMGFKMLTIGWMTTTTMNNENARLFQQLSGITMVKLEAHLGKRISIAMPTTSSSNTSGGHITGAYLIID